jgi:hypothetical protein
VPVPADWSGRAQMPGPRRKTKQETEEFETPSNLPAFAFVRSLDCSGLSSMF